MDQQFVENDLKRCSKCDNEKLMTHFHKKSKSKDILNPICKSCGKQYYNENLVKIKKKFLDNRDLLLINQTDYCSENYDKIIARKKIYSNIRYKTDIIFRFICKTSSRIQQALRSRLKSSSTKEFLGIDIDTYRKWIEYQMTLEMNWSNIEIDHVKPIYLFDISNNHELKEAFCWKNTQPLLEKNHQQKGLNFNFLDYQLQFIEAYQFLFNEMKRDLTEILIDEYIVDHPLSNYLKNYPTNQIISNHID